MTVKGCRDINWGAFDHASLAPQLCHITVFLGTHQGGVHVDIQNGKWVIKSLPIYHEMQCLCRQLVLKHLQLINTPRYTYLYKSIVIIQSQCTIPIDILLL